MTSRSIPLLARLACLAGLVGVCPAAKATLGQMPLPPVGASAGVPAKRVLSATAAAATPSPYTENTITLETGTVVREFVNAQGLVFAVTWAGPVLPDLGALFGDYFKSFRAEAERNRAARKRGAPIALASDEVVMASRGRMGHFSGHAYVPALVPAGVDPHALLR